LRLQKPRQRLDGREGHAIRIDQIDVSVFRPDLEGLGEVLHHRADVSDGVARVPPGRDGRRATCSRITPVSTPPKPFFRFLS